MSLSVRCSNVQTNKERTMRKEVYEKFAEALGAVEKANRMQAVRTKVAEALGHRQAEKRAEAIYAEGFCKAAELAGVDPRALMKAAAGEYAGAVPTQGAKAVGKSDIPLVHPVYPRNDLVLMGSDSPAFNSDMARSIADTHRDISADPETVAALETGATDPRYWSAHTTAVDRVTAPWRKATAAGVTSMPRSIRDAIVRNYHNEMASLTGTPQRVSIPQAGAAVKAK